MAINILFTNTKFRKQFNLRLKSETLAGCEPFMSVSKLPHYHGDYTSLGETCVQIK